jgi:hypothetical protein
MGGAIVASANANFGRAFGGVFGRLTLGCGGPRVQGGTKLLPEKDFDTNQAAAAVGVPSL